MNKLSKIFLAIIIILIIALIFTIHQNYNLRKSCKQNLDYLLEHAERSAKDNQRIQYLEEQLNTIKSENIE